VIHPIDRAAGIAVARGPNRLKFFSEGWGDADWLEPPDLSPQAATAIKPTWLLDGRSEHGHIVLHGTYDTGDESLPSRSRIGNLLSIEPAADTTRTVVLMAAWNEHDPRVRVALAHRLAEVGIRSVIPENPYYGSRHPNPIVDQPIRTVSDFMRMGIAAVSECRGLLVGLRDGATQLGVAGYSMGGNVSAIISATMDFPVATAPLAASHSPGPVFLDGVLRSGISWEALGGEDQADRLRDVLSSVSVLRIPPKDHTRRAVIVAGRSDGYIPLAATTDLANHWPGSELRVLSGGHATLVWYRKAALVDAIVASFDRLNQAPS
jgi:hypothetical protein